MVGLPGQDRPVGHPFEHDMKLCFMLVLDYLDKADDARVDQRGLDLRLAHDLRQVVLVDHLARFGPVDAVRGLESLDAVGLENREVVIVGLC